MVSTRTVYYPTEFLNTLEPTGVSSHTANNSSQKSSSTPSLCNGTRLYIKKLMPSSNEATIMIGHAAGVNVFLPRIPIFPLDFPFQFKRLQFPVRLRFAISINKAQRKFLKVVGLDLLKPRFSHGQLHLVVQELEKPKICTF
ncbi:hypothetical protein AVEN_55062-1 [Araneus ventricosus]|uniref:ATP-dependent DNA helicase n=1 Tax=Araneus ventricosus TaxID=182803 RepID=A0A4Y2GW69_ARAVE|nr:hypothetical protein AVEN_55062-1 [Araneus ventricosus]